jgi:DNA ligase-1
MQDNQQIGATLYQLDSKDKVRVWSIYVEPIQTTRLPSSTVKMVVVAGLESGKKTETTLLVSGKNTGKANETTAYNQAIKEAQAKIVQQVRKGYVEDRANLKPKDELGSGMKQPMLAQKYDPTGKVKGSKTLEQLGIVGQTVAVQPKLDGNRAHIVVTFAGPVEFAKVASYTRKGDLTPVQLPELLEDVLFQVCKSNWSPGTKQVTVDGEYYVHGGEMSFEELNGLLRKVDAAPEQVERRKLIKFHIYDLAGDTRGFEQRNETINSVFHNTDYVEVVRTDFVPATDEELHQWFVGVLSQGYEGLIIRQLNKPYEHKRTWQLLKYKPFVDAEFKLAGFEEDKRGGMVANFVMWLPKSIINRDGKTENTFGAGVSGQTQEECKYMWEHQDEFIGRMATVRYAHATEYGKPLFAKFKAFRDEGY